MRRRVLLPGGLLFVTLGSADAQSTGPDARLRLGGTVSSLGVMAGAGFRLSRRLVLEAQYHHATLGDARALMPMRLSVTF